MARRETSRGRGGRLGRLSDDELLDLRFCDLGVAVEGTWLARAVARLHAELARKGLSFRPHVWLSNEWFSPDGVPGIAIPFYLAHPRLMKLERDQMLEVEGGTRESCLSILRHEAGHAIDAAYALRRRRAWTGAFGRASRRYPTYYRPRPYSRKHVLHLGWWYAQSHPLEDFAETFAVWLKPGSRWRGEYASWPALRKLEVVNDLMREIARRPPLIRSRELVDPLSRMRRTLRSHYRAKRALYGRHGREIPDRDLKRLFTEGGRGESAAAFLKRCERELRELVARWTGQHPYTIDQLLKEMIRRCRALGVRLSLSERETRLAAAVLLTARVMEYLHRRGREVTL